MGDTLNTENFVRAHLSSNEAQLYMPQKMLSAVPNLTLPKPICSVQYTPSLHQPMSRIVCKEGNLAKNHGYSKLPQESPEKNTGMIALEHCYARPLNWKPDSSFYQPTKLLFMQQASTKKKSTNPLAPHQECDDYLDVEFVPPAATELYDKAKAVNLMEECDRHIANTKMLEGDHNWEDSIIKTSWTPIQVRLFNGMANMLNSDYLARSAHFGNHHEPILRRTLIDKSVRRIRQLFSSILWDTRLTQWIHQLLLDHLTVPYLSAYLDILQTLKSKLPTFVDKIMFGPMSSSRIGPTSIENLFQLLKRPWDPFNSYLSHNKPRKLPGNPVIIIVPSAPTISNTIQYKRQHKWMNLLANLCTVVAVHTNIGNNANRLTMINCADQMLTATRAKVQEVKAEFSGRTIILVGFNAGAALALQAAQVENVFCVVCMGFSVITAQGKRGEPDDSLLELQCPVLFVIGQCSNTSTQEDIEDLRERMRVENGLIVIGSADDCLRINKKKKRSEGITQSAVDRLVVESVGEFISGLMLSPYPPQVRQSPTQVLSDISAVKRVKIDRKRNNSNGSSLESEPPSPTPKITRPVGRPPGSKSKNKLEAKWAAQVAQGTLTPPSPPPPPLPPLSQITPKPVNNIPSSLPVEPSLPHSLPNSVNIKQLNTSSQMSNADKQSSIDVSDNCSNKKEAGNTIPSLAVTPNMLPTSKPQSSGIRVLDSVTFHANLNAKPVIGSKQSIDLSKMTVLNSVSASKNLSNVVLMPDGKIKTLCSTVKTTGGAPVLLPMSHKNKQTPLQIPHSIKHGVTKYITSKKQLLGRKPPYPPQKSSIISPYAASLPPPTNLTSQDIMDLPIIFADDHKLLTDNSELQQVDIPVPEMIQPPIPPPKLPPSNPVGKFVFLNKQQPLLQALTAPALKRPTLSVPVRTTAHPPPKYTKIIISRGLNTDLKNTASTTLTKITHLSPDISIRRIETPKSSSSTTESVDLENKLTATTIPKPEYTITVKNEKDYGSSVAKLEKSLEVIKRNALAAELQNVDDDDDPDYIPPKSVKIK